MTERLAVARMGKFGDGICETPNGALYIPYALPGEIVTVEQWPGHPDRRHLVGVEIASPERVAPICPHFGVCGGCLLQHWDLGPYRKWKRTLVIEALARAGLDAPVLEFIDAHGEGRRRVVLHARPGPRHLLEVGFSARKSHHVVAIDHCPVLAPSLRNAIATAWSIAEQIADGCKPLDIQITAAETGLDVDVRGSGPLSPMHVARLAEVARRQRLARLTRHGEIVARRAAPMVSIGRARVELPPGAFLQPTTAGEKVLAQLVETHCAGCMNVADLFCGIGPFALRLAERARVRAVDYDAAAIGALRRAAETTPGLKPVVAQARDLFARPLIPDELKPFDAVVFDPPRQGAEAQARALAACAVRRVVAVSCNPTTLARDARILVDGGYRLLDVTPVDQFLYSTHVEVVARLERASVG